MLYIQVFQMPIVTQTIYTFIKTYVLTLVKQSCDSLGAYVFHKLTTRTKVLMYLIK